VCVFVCVCVCVCICSLVRQQSAYYSVDEKEKRIHSMD
jgi:hypothetical protein